MPDKRLTITAELTIDAEDHEGDTFQYKTKVTSSTDSSSELLSSLLVDLSDAIHVGRRCVEQDGRVPTNWYTDIPLALVYGELIGSPVELSRSLSLFGDHLMLDDCSLAEFGLPNRYNLPAVYSCVEEIEIEG